MNNNELTLTLFQSFFALFGVRVNFLATNDLFVWQRVQDSG